MSTDIKGKYLVSQNTLDEVKMMNLDPVALEGKIGENRMALGLLLIECLALVDKAYNKQWDEATDSPTYNRLYNIARSMILNR